MKMTAEIYKPRDSKDIFSKQPESGGEAWNRLSLTTLKNNLIDILISNF